MTLTKEKAKANLAILIEKFEKELTSGRAQEYNEEATKTAFIQPLLEDVLGWDVSNRDEVSPEEKISRGRVDYGLKIENKTKIFVEAKPVRADLNKHIEQAVRYGYNRKDVPFVLLTDFEGIKLFDVTVKPDLRNPLKGLKLDLSWKQYIPQFDKIWVFSKESVAKGELEKLLLIKPKERFSVDKAILDDLKKWRESLAKDIFKNNPSLFHSEDPLKDADYLKEITQKILDRIIFMRSCEDRGLVHRRFLKELFQERTEAVGTNTMIFLKDEMQFYNIVFDSDLFRPQEWEDVLAVDFKVMCDIMLDTYNPYQFDVIPLEVLGNIYEQYLGYTIRLTEHQLKYELKPDVRKASGVYYTPEYIVDYIVKNTIGKLLQELPERKIKKLRILDPACGSGSFLIRAYEEMLHYYQSQKKHKKKEDGQARLDFKHEEAAPRLTIHEKSEILRNHIFGVDIDEQAVEVTKLSLMLKMLEGEHGFIPGRAVLPMLNRNIRCGNSLISGDVLELKKYFGETWYQKKPINWNEDFKDIMNNEGGLDVIIGNPPYIKEFVNKDAFDGLRNSPYYQVKMDIWTLFACKAIDLLKDGGYLSFIAPNNWLTNAGASIFRKKMLCEGEIEMFVDFGDFKVFKDAGIQTMVFVFRKRKPRKLYNVLYAKIHEKDTDERIISRFLVSGLKEKVGDITSYNLEINSKGMVDKNIVFVNRDKEDILTRIENKTNFKLQELEVGQGIVAAPDKYFLVNNISKFGKEEKEYLKPYYTASGRYLSGKTKSFIFYISNKNFEGKNIHDFPNISEHFEPFKKILKEARIKYGTPKKPYFYLHRERDENFFKKGPKIVCGVRTMLPSFHYTEDEYYGSRALNFIKTKRIDLKYLTSILNSRLVYFWLKNKGKQLGDLLQIDKGPLLNTPLIKTDDFQLQNKLIALVNVMLGLNEKAQTAKGNEKEQIQRQIEKTDKEIDDLVYNLYGITKEERKIIETAI